MKVWPSSGLSSTTQEYNSSWNEPPSPSHAGDPPLEAREVPGQLNPGGSGNGIFPPGSLSREWTV